MKSGRIGFSKITLDHRAQLGENRAQLDHLEILAR